MKREDRGVTLCNKVLTEALELRANEYEDELEEEMQKDKLTLKVPAVGVT
jgi:hypothetical protein